MADGSRQWLVAAACCEGPRPSATFADLSRQDQGEIVRVAVVTVAAAAYFVTLGILARPIPSRSLLTGVSLPHAPAPRAALAEAFLTTRVAMVTAPAPRVRATRAPQVKAVDDPLLLKISEPAGRRTPAPPRQERQGNLFSRFFRGVWRTVQAPVRANSL